MNLNLLEVKEIVQRALAEDIGSGDITTLLTVPPGSTCRAQIIAREHGVIAGLEVAMVVLDITADSYAIGSASVPCDKPSHTESTEPEYAAVQVESRPDVLSIGRHRNLLFAPEVADGDRIEKDGIVGDIIGHTPIILTAERTLLNFLQRMSGIATKTAALVELISHTKAKLVDTRKTTPGLRILEKYAVRMGGGRNHRFGLYDAVLIKDNHVKAAGGIRPAILAAKSGAPHTIKIEVETDTIDQVREALDAGADMILLDNMDLSMLREAVDLCRGRAITEASGGVTEESIVSIAETGVDLISVGALTHSVKALDLSLEIAD